MVQDIIIYIQPILKSHPFLAPVIFIVTHILMAVFFLPCSAMTLLAGVLWGGPYGLAISIIAASSSSATTFMLSRSFLRKRIEFVLSNKYPKIQRLLAKAADYDWKIVAVSQMNPLVPASTLGYFFGLSQVHLKRYLLFSLVFMLPLQFLFVMTGHSLTSLVISNGRWGITSILFLVIVTFIIFSKPIYKKLCLYMGVKDET